MSRYWLLAFRPCGKQPPHRRYHPGAFRAGASVTLQLLGLMTVLTLLPSILLMMTSFTRIIIVLPVARQALSTAQTPPNQILLGIALFLTIFIMAPVFTQVYDDAIAYSNDEMELEAAIDAAQIPIKDFMLRQTREKLQTFVSI